MPIQNTPFYAPEKTYEENYRDGPFGGFQEKNEYQMAGEPKYDFSGHKIFAPFGIPAGPLLNANFIQKAFQKGLDLPIYKTVRTRKHPCSEFPNVIPIHSEKKLTIETAKKGLFQADSFEDPIAITNSFGVPSYDPDIWQPDMKKAQESARKGQIMIASFQGTERNEGEQAFLEDWKTGAKLLLETGIQIIELNLSCPNEGKKNLLCHDTKTVIQVAEKVKGVVGNIPVLLKMSYFHDNMVLTDFIEKMKHIVQGFCVINTLPGEVRKKNGEQALPGKGRLIAGICGAPIQWAGLDMVRRVKKIRENNGGEYVILGSGGVIHANDYHEYIHAGADVVMSATGAMWNAHLAQEIKESGV